MKTEDQEEEISDYEDELKGNNAKKKKKKFKNCFFCDKIFDVHSVEQTIKPKYRCQECFDANIVKKIKYKEVKCNFCDKKFLHPYYTKKGLTETKTKSKKCEECQNRKIPKGPLPRPKMENAECDICGLTFHKKILIYNHMDKHRSDVYCRVCNAKFTARSALRGHLRTHFEKFVCELCGYTTNVNAMFRNHKKIHSGIEIKEKPRHNYKPKKGDFPCSVCGIVFQSRIGLMSHEKRQHAENGGINGFPCKICGEVSYRIKEYRIHVLTHSSKPLLFCQYPGCNIFYDRLKPLNAHIRNVHNQGVNQYSCSNCGKAFKYKSSIDKHVRKNRCIPLKERKFKTDAISKRMKPFIENEDKSPEELERIIKIAKEQYLEVRGLLSVIENEKHSDSEQEDTVKEEVIIDENTSDETGLKIEKLEDVDDVLVDDNYQQFDDCLDVSPVIENAVEVVEDIVAKEPFVKVEIKTEPDIDGMLSTPIVHDDWNYLKSDPDIFNMSIDLPNPYVLLEKLDYATIMKWISVKSEENDIKPDILNRKQMTTKRRKKMLNKKRSHIYRRIPKGSFYECDMCEFKNESKLKLAQHLSSHIKIHKHKCDLCTESFSNYTHLNQHKRAIHKIVHPEFKSKDYICDLCGKAYATIFLIKTHLKLVHSTKTYTCQYCPMKFKIRLYVERHENDVHLNIRKYACQFCGKCFKRRHGLANHEKRHTSNREICPICGKSVKILKEHIKVIHETKREQELIPCEQCGKRFTKYNMQFHIQRFHLKVINERTQIRYCLKCDQSFPRVDDLRRHDILEHFDGVIKKCPFDFCDAIFKKTKPLNVHIKNVHARGITHCCEICKKTFNTRSGLLKHAKIKGHKIPEKTL